MKQPVDVEDMFRWVVMAGVEDTLLRALQWGVDRKVVEDEMYQAFLRAADRFYRPEGDPYGK